MRQDSIVVRRAALLLLPALLVATTSVYPQAGRGAFRDSLDGRFDMSEWLLNRKGFLVVPTVITEPAVGYGAALGIAFFSRSIAQGRQATGTLVPPTVAGGIGFYTSGGSYGGGIGVFHPFHDDRFRYVGALGAASLDLDFYGFDPDGPLADNPVAYTIEGLFTQQRFQGRLGGSPWFLGGEYVFLHTTSRFDAGLPAEIPPADVKVDVGGLGASVEYDTRDNLLDARHGVDIFGGVTWYDEAFGGDESFGKAKFEGLFYGQPHERWELGLRTETRFAWGDPPFFEKPYLVMRGLPALRYANDVTVLGEGELRFAIDHRWSVLGFGGAGWVATTWDALGDASAVGAGGAGFRYLIARELGLRSGVDFAFGPGGDFSFYIQTGAAWR